MGSDGLRSGDAGCWCDAFVNLYMYVTCSFNLARPDSGLCLICTATRPSTA